MTPTEHPSPVPQVGRPFQGHRAGIVSRTIAAAVDLLVVVAIVTGCYLALAAVLFAVNPTSFSWPDSFAWSIPLVGFVIVVPYLTLSWCTTGRTYGDALLGLRVININGRRMRLPGAVLRAVLCVVFPIGLLWTLFSPANRSLQDMVLRTSVIYDWAPQTEGDARLLDPS
ncbi:RDD family protein [Jatrophihabitans sp. DSM 45814]